MSCISGHAIFLSYAKYYQMVFPSYGKVKFGGKYLIKISKEPTFPRAILFLSNVLYHEGLANSHLHFLRILNILLSL